jgi:hypothetical protein
MADFKRRTLYLSTGKQIKLYGASIAIGKSLELGEGYAPNIFSVAQLNIGENPGVISADKDSPEKLSSAKMARKTPHSVSNPYRLTLEEVLEIADYNIRLWMDLKDRVRENGVNSSKIFNGSD